MVAPAVAAPLVIGLDVGGTKISSGLIDREGYVVEEREVASPDDSASESDVLEALGGTSLMPLAVCATPIGNLDDVTLRVLDELRAADLVLCEDTRRTRILLERHGIEARLSSYHRHNEAARTAQVLESLRAGERVALVSDAGLPGVNDPGARLIAAAVAEAIEV